MVRVYMMDERGDQARDNRDKRNFQGRTAITEVRQTQLRRTAIDSQT